VHSLQSHHRQLIQFENKKHINFISKMWHHKKIFFSLSGSLTFAFISIARAAEREAGGGDAFGLRQFVLRQWFFSLVSIQLY
jgi:hypothetical protein